MVEHQPSKLDTWVRFPSPALMQGYRSGHNEAVLKTVCPQGRVGSNPTLSVSQVAENNLKKLKKVLDKFWRTGYNTQGFSSERLK